MRAHVCSIDGRVLLGAFFAGVLLEVLVCKHCYLGSMLVNLFKPRLTMGSPLKRTQELGLGFLSGF